jgi:hypothetical protein
MGNLKVGGKSKPRPRVADTEPKSRSKKSARHIQPTPATLNLVDGEAFVSVQHSELAPVAQFANVQLGPVQVSWKLSNINMEDLIDVDWGELDEDGDLTFDEAQLTPKQRATYERIMGALRATSKVANHLLAEDRWLVDESIRLHNAREAAEEEKNAPKKPRPRSR